MAVKEGEIASVYHQNQPDQPSSPSLHSGLEGWLASKSGMWKGFPKGDRRFKVDISKQNMNLGTFHMIAGWKVRVLFPGSIQTCGICHRAGHKARTWKQNKGSAISIKEHMHNMHKALEIMNIHYQVQNQAEDGQKPASTSIHWEALPSRQQSATISKK